MKNMPPEVNKIMKSWTWKMFTFLYWLGWLEYFEYDFPNKKWLYKFQWLKLK